MAHKKNEKPLNAAINKKLFERFETQRKKRAQTKKLSVEWAIRTWMSLPAEIQASIIDRNSKDILSFLVEKLLDVQILKLLESVPAEERSVLIEQVISGKI